VAGMRKGNNRTRTAQVDGRGAPDMGADSICVQGAASVRTHRQGGGGGLTRLARETNRGERLTDQRPIERSMCVSLSCDVNAARKGWRVPVGVMRSAMHQDRGGMLRREVEPGSSAAGEQLAARRAIWRTAVPS
jgi:hypothetical protein